jgi:hypothetical protein
MKATIAFATALLLAACARQPEEISTTFVSPHYYRSHNCKQLEVEARQVARRAGEIHGELAETADADAAQMGIGLILFLPALLLLEGGDDMQAAQYSRIKGESSAIEKVAIEKGCPITFAPSNTKATQQTDKLDD